MNKLAIVIPIYKETLDISEHLSLNSLFSTLKRPIENKDIFIATFKGLDISKIEKIASEYDIKLNRTNFNKSYFQNTISYSNLCKSYEFYVSYMEYTYMLIFQTDVYMTKDDIDYWMETGYDYIGAPIISSCAKWHKVPNIGNGGCSLRKISTFMDITNPEGYIKTNKEVLEKESSVDNGVYIEAEDMYFSELVYEYYDFEKPRLNEAIFFGIDMNADVIMKMTNDVLPSFIHAFEKNIKYWQSRLEVMSEPKICAEAQWKYRNDYFSSKINYQNYLTYNQYPFTSLCTIWNGEENIKDWVEYHLSIGINKIIIYDICELGSQKLTDIIGNNWKDNIVICEKYRGNNNLSEILSHCYKMYVKDVDLVMPIKLSEKLSDINYSELKNSTSNIIDVDNRMFIKTNIDNFNLKTMNSSLLLEFKHDKSNSHII